MPSASPEESAAVPRSEPKAGFWRRRVLTPIVEQLTQGVTPERIALSVALGVVVSIIPILGLSTLLCVAVAARLRLNQPLILTVNWLCYPLQLSLLIPFYRAGEYFGAPHLSLSIPQLAARFAAGPVHFIMDFGGIALGGVAAWSLVAPLLVLTVYLGLRGPLRLLARRVRVPVRA